MTSNYDTLLTKVQNKENIMLHGPGGTGKSFMINRLYNELSPTTKIYKTATTGIAALNIQGETIHSFLKIQIGTTPINKRIYYTKQNAKLYSKLRLLQVLIVDEISMMGTKLFTYISEYLQGVRGNKQLWGGVTLVFSGDFYQLPPVKDEWIFSSSKFSGIEILTLSECKRYNDVEWFKILLEIRKGYVSDEIASILSSRVGKDVSVGDIKPTKLYCRNLDVDAHNYRCLSNLQAEEFTFDADDAFLPCICKTPKTFGEPIKRKDDQEFFFKNDDIFKALAKDIVQLKVGAQIMVTYNIDVNAGLVNGTRGVVVSLEKNRVKINTKRGLVDIERISYPFDSTKGRYIRSQYPLTLAFSMTVHKCQGLTLDCVDLNLDRSFAFGQAYVALSRVRDLESLSLSSFRKTMIKVSPEVTAFLELRTLTLDDLEE